VAALVRLLDGDLPTARPQALPPLNIVRPADDAEPDPETNTPIDRWLNQQFSKAA
jgi:hypothetical protein